MGDLFGSVRRSLVFRTASDHDETPPPVASTSTTAAVLVDKISSCVRKSRIFSKPSSPLIGRENAPPPIRWRRGELIGCGAFGRVYTGMNLDSGELLAVKQVLIAASSVSKEKSQAHIRELEEEVKLLKNLSHPNIVRYLGTIREEDTLNILLEFVPGGSISSLLGKFGAFPETVMRTYTKQLLLGLEYLHNNGIMHRDIKGANILVDNKGCIKLADFGASKQVVELATGSGAKSMKGTPYWMAPEVILQTGHSFSADIWSVGCTVIEMATGKPPWSQQYLEVAAVLFHIGTTKSHPPIPEHLSEPAKDFLLRCLQREPDLRPTASQLLQHPFVTGKPLEPQSTTCTSAVEQSEFSSASNTPDMIASPTSDMCNLGSLSGSIVSPQKFDYICNNADDDMCQMDSIMGTPDKSIKSFNPMSEPSVDWRCKFDETPIPQQTGMKVASVPSLTGNLSQERNEFSFPSGNSLPEEDDELTESKIRDFLDEKAVELKKLQTPLYEEFYNSINIVCSPVFPDRSPEEKETPKYLKLPPKSRSPSRGTPGNNTDIVSTASPGSNSSRQMTNTGNLSGQSSPDVASSPQLIDVRGPAAAADVPNESTSPMLSKSERERKWKEELDRELERQREMMRQAGSGGKTSSPIDRAMNRPREKTRFASPGK